MYFKENKQMSKQAEEFITNVLKEKNVDARKNLEKMIEGKVENRIRKILNAEKSKK